MKKRIAMALVGALCVGLFSTGCGAQKPSKEEGKEAVKEEQSVTENAELTMAITKEPATGFDPCTGWGKYGNTLFFSRLLDTNDDMELVNDIATEYSYDEEAMTWTFKIRDDIYFTDGEKLTASDVAFTYMTAKNAKSTIDLTALKSAEAVDETTVKFTLNEMDSSFIYQTSMLGIVPEHCYNEEFSKKPVGSGQWKFSEWTTGQQVIIERNDDYYGDVPEIEKITLVFMDSDAAFAAIQAGEVDVIRTTIALANEEVDGYHLEKCETVNNTGLCFAYQEPGEVDENGLEIGDPITSNRAIRQSICYAINREDICEYAINGLGTPSYGLADGMPWFNEETVFEDGNMEKAVEILEEDGWKDTDGDGVREKDGLKAEFDALYTPDCPDRYAMLLAIIETAKEIGIQINPVTTNWDEITTLRMNTSWMMAGGHYTPTELMNYCNSEFGGGTNYSYYANSKVDEYLKQAKASTDMEESLNCWKKVQWDGETGASMLGDAPVCWVAKADHLFFVRDGIDVGNQKPHSHGSAMSFISNIADWKVTK